MSKRFRQPNPLPVKYGCLHPERMDLKQMFKLKDWVERAIQWRYAEEQPANNRDAEK